MYEYFVFKERMIMQNAPKFFDINKGNTLLHAYFNVYCFFFSNFFLGTILILGIRFNDILMARMH